ncbi:shikimate kinase [Oceanobacillus caeni]|uniref:shikimate kinase n=1 Tax=Oceanobacillus caeni TaxID=405946 RepID=UPI001C24C4F7|nr:shikimate kinase [Oceanobacillus caeni]MBU8790272.1 shikimate kinase [Oceanobacillus caeni]
MGLNNVSLREQNIVLIGFMGAGKTTIGKAVARKLYRDFIDIDEEIEKQFNMPTSQIFQVFGEKTFREKEKEIIQDFCKNQRLKIISLGGGAFLQEEIKETCLANSIVFYLSLSWESWKERISMIIDNRPVLQGKNYEEMKELFEKRQPIYEEHHSKVATDKQNVEEIADYIVSSLKTAWDIYEPNR